MLAIFSLVKGGRLVTLLYNLLLCNTVYFLSFQDFLSLEVKQKFALNLNFDTKVDEDETEAYFIRKNSKLIVKMKCVSS